MAGRRVDRLSCAEQTRAVENENWQSLSVSRVRSPADLVRSVVDNPDNVLSSLPRLAPLADVKYVVVVSSCFE